MEEIKLVSAYLFDGKGRGQELNFEEVNNWSKRQGILWIHLDYKKSNAKSWLCETFNLSQLIGNALFTEDVRPRTIPYQNGVLTFFRGINLNPGEPPEDMVSLRCWVTEDLIITSRSRHIYAIDDLRKSLLLGTGPTTSQDFLISLIKKITYRINETIEQIDEKFDNLEEQVLLEQDINLKTKISSIRRIILLLRRYLAPQREALGQLQLNTLNLLTDWELPKK